MNKTVRFLLVVALLVGVIAVAGGTAVWASPAAKAPEAVSAKADAALPAAGSLDGTVSGGDGCSGKRVQDGEKAGICGLATVATQVGSSVFAKASAGGILSLFFDRGSALICFAAPHNGVIYFQPHPGANNVWFPIATRVENGRACANVSANGYYKFSR